MLSKDEIAAIVEDYDRMKLRIGMTASHSALDICDGAIEEGVFYESINFASVKNLPVLFICENNLYSVYSSLTERQPPKRKIYKMVNSIGVNSKFCRGDDISEIYKSLIFAISQIKKNKKPFFLEFSSYRWREHCGPNYDNKLGYRSEKEFLLKLEKFI